MPYQTSDDKYKHKKSKKSHKRSSKLHLKDTPAEHASREEKKIRKRAKEALKRTYGDIEEIDEAKGDEGYDYVFDFDTGPSTSSSTRPPPQESKSKRHEHVDEDEELYWRAYPDPRKEFDGHSHDLQGVFAEEEEPSLDIDEY